MVPRPTPPAPLPWHAWPRLRSDVTTLAQLSMLAAVYAYTRAAAAARFILGSLTFGNFTDHVTAHVEYALPMAALLLPARQGLTPYTRPLLSLG
jgi:hypothetical protein